MKDVPIDVYGDDEAWWPERQQVSAEETVDARCVGCQMLWHVHRDLEGSRLRCRCGEWVEVPAAEPAEPLAPEAAPLISVREPGGTEVEPSRARREIAAARPQEPGALLLGSARDRARWTDRTIIELALMMLAFIGPSLYLMVGTIGDERAVLTPLAGVATSLLVFLIALGSHSYAFQGLRWTHPKYFAEALVGTGVALGFAWLWLQFLTMRPGVTMEDPFGPLEEKIGLGMVIFVVGVVPGIFEEIAFRGLVQGRLTVLFGRSQGILITGLAFALAHGGITLAFPIHAGIGIYLCWLRARCGSLLPGMLLHFLYNTTLVVTGL